MKNQFFKFNSLDVPSYDARRTTSLRGLLKKSYLIGKLHAPRGGIEQQA